MFGVRLQEYNGRDTGVLPVPLLKRNRRRIVLDQIKEDIMHTQRIKVLDQIKEDIKFDDYTALYELLKYLPHYAISEYLPKGE
jgi:hypothetical protein